ncbi:phosphopantetheine-binding protein [Micromonospora sp. KC207]|uniref:phosphopantetheine-binding protein n=1 Tax=Micromonospora sp. KC207 TaxID=2530377 RepID=UPI00104B5D39|nr:phosphopantetheine-binding protein [Micromonospora sp. KC207]TDC63752.1 phosphopantetheine-binding protein [Micromonospora sp. KC207]
MDDPDLYDRYAEVLRPLLMYADEGPLDRSLLLADLGLDSLGIIQALVEIEAAFDVEFPDDWLVAETFASVGSLWDSVSNLIGTRRADAA